MTVEDPDRRVAPGLSGRELTVIILTVTVVAVALVLAFVSRRVAMDCEPKYSGQDFGPAVAAFLLPLACVVPLGLALACKLRPEIWIWTLVALVFTPFIVGFIVLSAGYCPS